ncbi:hypothetical protein B0F90DRAFT_1821766 [Multifurca ochricompacta]|uniref:Fe2OG dioxygenase domain-containing protein n=1 Tax=Multifurca ochricompacta TaxID=376703 RepID=A0AAD4LX40_9AGAM|nr:hypothetical protein B0F90DRAFT_1821766 [Multifurca ochricompacta]
MHQSKTDIQGAIKWVHEYQKELGARFRDIYENEIPKFGEPVDEELAPYVHGLGNWTRGNDQWDYEKQLSQAFGRNKEDVMDENYRKARTMDPEYFSAQLVPERIELVKVVHDYLLEGKDSKRDIKVGLYKLNVNDKGSFFKSHVDTPRGKNMFGSLVFPTAHEDGTLHLRHHGQEWTFNSASEISGLRTPSMSIGYIAFFSDVEHEVAPVISCHRVTLTYNLFFDDGKPTSEKDSSSDGSSYLPVAVKKHVFWATLESFLEDPEFLEYGGTLGFGLRHVYPVSNDRLIDYVYDLLKGSDVVIYETFKSLGFEPKLYLYYEWSSPQSDSIKASIIDWVVEFDECAEDTDVTREICNMGGIVVWHKDRTGSRR